MPTKKHDRISWDEYFMQIAHLVAQRSTCLRRNVGAVIVKNKRMLATGYNGAPTGMKHCLDIGCLREKLHVPSGQRHELCRALHAEQNALIQASLYGIPVKDSIIYITHSPCTICAKMLINAGIKEIIIAGQYPDEMATAFLKEAGLKIRLFQPNPSHIPAFTRVPPPEIPNLKSKISSPRRRVTAKK